MAQKKTHLRVPYGGYLHRHVPAEDESLTHVGPGTPAGTLFSWPSGGGDSLDRALARGASHLGAWDMALDAVEILVQGREQFQEVTSLRDARHDNIKRDGWPGT